MCVKEDEVVCEYGQHDRLSKRGCGWVVGGAQAKRGGVDRTCNTMSSLAAKGDRGKRNSYDLQWPNRVLPGDLCPRQPCGLRSGTGANVFELQPKAGATCTQKEACITARYEYCVRTTCRGGSRPLPQQLAAQV
jgi:hypothetical protein